jgi:hypothetical protein
MAAFSDEQLQQLRAMLGTMVQQATSVQGAAPPAPSPDVRMDEASRGGYDHSKLDFRKFTRIDKWDGSSITWKSWAWQIKMAIRSCCPKLGEAMDLAERTKDDVEVDGGMDLEDRLEGSSLLKRAHELYEVLALSCTGEALLIMQGVRDMDGVSAWQKLHKKYNAKTVARTMMQMMQVMSPPKVKEQKALVSAIEKWEAKVKDMEQEYGDEIIFTNIAKMSIFTSMCPDGIQDIILQQVEAMKTYRELRDKVVSITSNRVAMADGPVPMEIGNVENEEEEQDVAAVGRNIQCHTCSGWGHMSRECPSKAEEREAKAGKALETVARRAQAILAQARRRAAAKEESRKAIKVHASIVARSATKHGSAERAREVV